MNIVFWLLLYLHEYAGRLVDKDADEMFETFMWEEASTLEDILSEEVGASGATYELKKAINMWEKAFYKDGYQVATGRETRHAHLVEAIDYAAKAYDDWRFEAFGLWKDGNEWVLDLDVKHVECIENAMALARRYNQKAIYSWAEDKSLPVPFEVGDMFRRKDSTGETVRIVYVHKMPEDEAPLYMLRIGSSFEGLIVTHDELWDDYVQAKLTLPVTAGMRVRRKSDGLAGTVTKVFTEKSGSQVCRSYFVTFDKPDVGTLYYPKGFREQFVDE